MNPYILKHLSVVLLKKKRLSDSKNLSFSLWVGHLCGLSLAMRLDAEFRDHWLSFSTQQLLFQWKTWNMLLMGKFKTAVGSDESTYNRWKVWRNIYVKAWVAQVRLWWDVINSARDERRALSNKTGTLIMQQSTCDVLSSTS